MEYLEAVNQALAASNASLEASHRRQAATILQMQADAPAVREMENDGDRFDALRRLVDIFDAWGDVETLLRVLAAYYGVK
jgi:hypothetical protein